MQTQLFEHGVISTGLQFVLGVAYDGAAIPQYQHAMTTLAPIWAPLTEESMAFGILFNPADEFISFQRPLINLFLLP